VHGSPGRGSWASAWIPVGFWILVIFTLSSIPDLAPPDVGLPLMDKLAHLGEYAVLGGLWARARGARTGIVLATGALFGAAVGGLDELYQSTVPGREVDGLDVVADTCGAAVGAFAFSRARAAVPRP